MQECFLQTNALCNIYIISETFHVSLPMQVPFEEQPPGLTMKLMHTICNTLNIRLSYDKLPAKCSLGNLQTKSSDSAKT